MGQAVAVLVGILLVVAAGSALAVRRHRASLAHLDEKPLRDEHAFNRTAERVVIRAAEIAAAEQAARAAEAGAIPAGGAASLLPDPSAPPAAAGGGPTDPEPAGPTRPPPPPPAGAIGPEGPGTTTWADGTLQHLLAGLRLPHGLVPLGDLAPRPGTGDRMAAWTDEAPVEVVVPALVDELRRLGFEVTPLDQTTMIAGRGAYRIQLVVHPVGATALLDTRLLFPSLPSPFAPAVELWVIP